MNLDHYEFNEKQICESCGYVKNSLGCESVCRSNDGNLPLICPNCAAEDCHQCELEFEAQGWVCECACQNHCDDCGQVLLECICENWDLYFVKPLTAERNYPVFINAGGRHFPIGKY